MPLSLRRWFGGNRSSESSGALSALTDVKPLRQMLATAGEQPIRPYRTNAGDVMSLRHFLFTQTATWALPGVVEFGDLPLVPNAELMRWIVDPRWIDAWECRVAYVIKANGVGGQSLFGKLRLQLRTGARLSNPMSSNNVSALPSQFEELDGWLDAVSVASNGQAYVLRSQQDDHLVGRRRLSARSLPANAGSRRSSTDSRRSDRTLYDRV